MLLSAARRPRRGLAFAGYTALIVLTLALVGFNVFQPIKVLPRAGLAPGWSFLNQAGERRTSEDGRGKLTLYTFAARRCETPCAAVAADVLSARRTLSTLTSPETLALVAILLDGQEPAALAETTMLDSSAAAGPVRLDLVRGDRVRVRQVVGGGFGVFFETSDDGTVRGYDPRWFLVDGWGVVRAEYRSAPLDTRRLVRDIGVLRAEVAHSRGALRYAYEAAHLFRCYA